MATEYKRDTAAIALSSLAEGYAFLRACADATDDAAKLRAAARAGSAAATAILLKRSPELARAAAVADVPHGALVRLSIYIYVYIYIYMYVYIYIYIYIYPPLAPAPLPPLPSSSSVIRS